MSLGPDSNAPLAGPTPAALGYRWPAEWAPHSATWLSWPRRRATWPKHFASIPAVWARLARTLAEFEPVHILAGGAAVLAEARSLVGETPNVTLHDVPTNDAWTRDHGPMFLRGPASAPPDERLALVDWDFNAWGRKYSPFDDDHAVPRRIAELLGARRFTPGIVLEGGSVDGNGAGTLLTTETCLLNPNRNPSLARSEIERYLGDYLGARKVLWLSGEVAGDDTDGHIDELARFVGPSTVLAAYEPDTSDENHAPLAGNLARLRTMTDADGRPLEVIPLRLPGAIRHEGKRAPASYMNFYIANGVVIAPQFGDPADAEAVATLAGVFPGREIRGLDARDLVWGRGGFHCITQQQPSVDG